MSKRLSDRDLVHLVDWENHGSPYYTSDHKRWRAKCKKFVEEHILPFIDKWEKKGDLPSDIYKKAYHDTSATAYVIFRNVRIHKSNIIGAVNQGFMMIMYNFNSERMGIIMAAIAFSRVCVEESAIYAKSRKTFGRLLIRHQVIRHKLAEMARQVLAVHSFMEKVSYQMIKDPMGMKDKSIPRNVSLLKVQATKTLEFCAREAAQIFGGRSYVRGGRAGKIERIYRDVRAFAIYGGSEEILLDMAIRQAKL